MTDLDRELRIAGAMAGDLKAYLLSDTLYWQLTDSGPKSFPFPLGTIGGMRLRLRWLEAARDQLSPDQLQHVQEVRDRADAELKRWAIQAEQKAAREIKARLQTWSAFLDDAIGDPARHIPEYPTQVENRVIMDMLFGVAGHAADGQNFQARLDSLDERLRANTVGSEFVWDAAFAPAFPKDHNWWLYVQLRK